jgi:hypothetical protein
MIAQPITINNSQPIVEIIYNNGGSSYDHIYGKNLFKGLSVTSSFKPTLNDTYSLFINQYELPLLQRDLFDKVLNYISPFIYLNNNLEKEIQLHYSVHNEAIVSRRSKNGIYNIVIDSDGDVMLSFSCYKEYGWRKFIDAADFVPSKNISDFFSI